MAYVYLLIPGSAFSCVFFANRASTRYARALERARKNAFADSKLRCLVACMYSKQQKRAGSELTLNAGFLTQLAGKWVGRGRCGPNPRKAGHLVCLNILNNRKQSYQTSCLCSDMFRRVHY